MPPPPPSQYSYAVVCASNMNRSMEAHLVLAELGARIESYGTGSAVRLPGASIDKPNIYPFGTPYAMIKSDLISKDPKLYHQNGLINMLNRNIQLKKSPERFQDRLHLKSHGSRMADIVLTCEERVFDAVCDDLMVPIVNRINHEPPKPNSRPVHVINLEIRDTAADAAIGGQAMAAIFNAIESNAKFASKGHPDAQNVHDLDSNLPVILRQISKTNPVSQFAILHAVCYQ